MSDPRFQENRLTLTNNYSILSKYSASKRDLFKDQILENFLEHVFKGDSKLSTRRTAQVNLGYAARQMTMNMFMNRNLEVCQTGCYIILGAGYDMLPLRNQDGQDCHWIEIDLPNVIDVKRQYIMEKFCIQEDTVLVSSDGNAVSFTHLRLHLISCDLRNTTELIQQLSFAFKNIPPDRRSRVTIVNEVCLCYLLRSEIELLLESIKNFLTNEQSSNMYYLGFEQVKPREGSHFADLMSSHFSGMGFELNYFPEIDQSLELFNDKLKFRHMTVLPMYQVFHNILMPSCSNKDLRDRDPFDEYEELDLYLSHYALIMGQCNLRSDYDITRPDMQDSEENDLIEGIRDISVEQRSRLVVHLKGAHSMGRYGHASCVLEDNADGGVALYTGGYGFPVGTTIEHPLHRLGDCALFKWYKEFCHGETQKLNVINGPEFDLVNSMSRMHGQVCQLENDLVFLNGGRQNPAKTPNALDNSLVGRVNGAQSTFEFVSKMNTTNSLRWRHRTLKLDRDRLIQVGGIRGNSRAYDEGAIGLWSLSSDKFGFSSVLTDQISQDLALDRHSFGADLRDTNSLLIFGGLQHLTPYDRPINTAQGVLMVDLRCLNQPVQLRYSGQCYDTHVHFLDDHQFIKYGGISTQTGLPEEFVELYDLRQGHQSLPIVKVKAADSSPIRFIPTKMTSVHFKQSHEIISLGGGGTYFTFGTHFNDCYHRINYDKL